MPNLFCYCIELIVPGSAAPVSASVNSIRCGKKVRCSPSFIDREELIKIMRKYTIALKK